MARLVVLYIGITTIFLQDKFSAALRAEYAKTKLPEPTYFATPIYDGNNNIYLFGGTVDQVTTKQILRYNIDSDSIVEIGEMPSYAYRGSTQ